MPTHVLLPSPMSSQSKLEGIVENRLLRAGVTFAREYKFHPTRRWRADFAVYRSDEDEPCCLVEVEGGIYHPRSGHRSVSGYLRDVAKYNEVVALGLPLVRVTEKDLNGKDANDRWLEIVHEVIERGRGRTLADPRPLG